MSKKRRRLTTKTAILHLVMCLLLATGFLTVSARTVSSLGTGDATALTTPDIRWDRDQDGIDDNLERSLANLYAPVIYMSNIERNYPVNVNWWLSKATLKYVQRCTDWGTNYDLVLGQVNDQWRLVYAPDGSLLKHPDFWGPGHDESHCFLQNGPPLSSTEPFPESETWNSQCCAGCQTFMLDDVADQDKLGCTDPSQWVTYVHVYPNNIGGVTIQYWHAFSYNEFNILNVIGNHGGDWDAEIQVVLNGDLQPYKVLYSRHSEDKPGTDHLWQYVHKYDTTHPIVFIDAGGHAAFVDYADQVWYWAPGPVFGCIADEATDFNGPIDNPDNLISGTVWETWDGGSVDQRGQVDHDISPKHGTSGGIVNLGEYNPGVNQEPNFSPAGWWLPVDEGTLFTVYSGRWGALGVIFSGPRGPVFQGWDGSNYTAWYNEASTVPASYPTFPWRLNPSTSLGVGSPAYWSGGTTYLSTTTPLTLTPSQNSIAADKDSITDGVTPWALTLRTYYKCYRVGDTPPADWTPYSGSFHLSGPDGTYRVDYYSMDALNNQDGPYSQTFVLDNTPPVINIIQPAATQYNYSSTFTALTLNYTVSDGTGSGVQSFSATMDGAATVAGHTLMSGQTLLVPSELSLDKHTFVVNAIDNLGNASSATVNFEIAVTPASIRDDVKHLVGTRDICRAEGPYLLFLLDAAAHQRANGACWTADSLYTRFILEIKSATNTKCITAKSSAILITEATYLKTHCP